MDTFRGQTRISGFLTHHLLLLVFGLWSLNPSGEYNSKNHKDLKKHRRNGIPFARLPKSSSRLRNFYFYIPSPSPWILPLFSHKGDQKQMVPTICDSYPQSIQHLTSRIHHPPSTTTPKKERDFTGQIAGTRWCLNLKVWMITRLFLSPSRTHRFEFPKFSPDISMWERVSSKPLFPTLYVCEWCFSILTSSEYEHRSGVSRTSKIVRFEVSRDTHASEWMSEWVNVWLAN